MDKCKAGDEAVICGIVLRRWQPLFVESRCNIELVLLANSVLIRNSEGESGSAHTTVAEEEQREEFRKFWSTHRLQRTPFRARDMIIKSFCPQLFSMYVVKLAVMLVLLGGVGRSQYQRRRSPPKKLNSNNNMSRTGSSSSRNASMTEHDENDRARREQMRRGEAHCT